MNHHCAFDDSKYDKWLSRIEGKLDRALVLITSVLNLETKIMALADDLKAALSGIADSLTALTASVATDVAEIETLLAKIVSSGGSVSDADVQAAIKDQVTAIDAEVAKAQAASP